MRKTQIIFSFCLLVLSSFAQQKNFIINGIVTDTFYHHGKVVLIYKDSSDRFKFDTATTNNGKFTFTGEVPMVSRMQLTVHAENNLSLSKRHKQIEIYFAIENCEAEVTISKFNDYTIKGSKCFTELLTFNESFSPLHKKYIGSELIQRQKSLIDSFINTKPSSYVSLLLLYERISNAIHLGELDKYYYKLPNEFQKSSIGLSIQKKLKKLKEISVGQIAPNFTMPDLKGNLVRISQQNRKYILLHFWGSWCNPCRQENANLIKAYNTLLSANIDFIGISVDESHDDLAKAIEKDKITWQQLTNFKGFNDPVIKDYGITGVPRNFLIDPNGKIIAMDLRGSDLSPKIKALIK